MSYASSLLTGPCLYVLVCRHLHGSQTEVSRLCFTCIWDPLVSSYEDESWFLISSFFFFIIRVPEIRLSPTAVLKEQWFSWCGCNFHSLYRSFGNHTCFYFKWMATFVARMWNCEFLMKKLQMIKIYFRHSLPRSTHWKLYRWWLQNWPLFNACEKSLEGGLLSEWQECGPPSHPTHNVRFNRPWNKHKNICF